MRRRGHNQDVKEALRKNPYDDKKPGWALWALRLVLLFLAVTACLTASIIMYVRWLGAAQIDAPWATAGAADLNPAERVYLQTYLAARSGQLSESIAAGVEPAEFVVEPGQTAGDIAAELAQAGLLGDTTLFLTYLRYHGLDSQLEAGTYRVDPRWSIPDLALGLTQSFGQEIALRFLEGWRVEEMAAYLSTVTPAKIEADAFLNIVQRRAPFDLRPYRALEALPDGASLEGFMFPDTYRVPLDADTAYLVDLMLKNFERRVTPEVRAAMAENGLSLREGVTLASIVEREAPLASERPRVAAVFYNRLAQSMPLQADPTVQYAVGFDESTGTWWKSGLTQADLQISSPYNTYVNTGLPPGPIANPSLSSLEAVAYPAQSNELFFVADCNGQGPNVGGHIFSETYAEHLSNVERCRQE